MSHTGNKLDMKVFVISFSSNCFIF